MKDSAIFKKIDEMQKGMMDLNIKFSSFHDTLKRNTKVLDEHNGRLKLMEEWRLRFEGGKTVIKSMWAVIGVLVIAGTFGMFNMYITVSKLPETVELQVLGIIENKIINSEITIDYD